MATLAGSGHSPYTTAWDTIRQKVRLVVVTPKGDRALLRHQLQ